MNSPKGAAPDQTCRVLASTIWIAFIVLCLGNSASTGLSYFDDAEMALVAQSFAHGTGYSTLPEATAADRTQFQPGISAGPTMIIPCAILLKIFGAREIIPSLSAVLLWASLLTFLFLRISQRVSGPFLLLGVAAFCLSVLAMFVWQFGAWYAFLGEGAAAAFLLLGHWILAMETPSSKWLFVSGLCLGLAVQTKYLAALGIPGSLLILFLRWRYSKDGIELSLGKVATWLGGGLAPTLFFEFWKFIELGRLAYVAHWTTFFATARSQGFVLPSHGALEAFRQRLASLEENLLINAPALTLLFVSILVIRMIWRRDDWTRLFAGMLVSVFSFVSYWIFYSVGRPRYLAIGMALACFTICIPVFSSFRFRPAILYLTLAGVALSGGIRRISTTMTRAADHGLFKASSERHARKKIVETLRRMREQGPFLVATRHRAETFAVEFDLNQEVHFQNVDSLNNSPGEKIVLINRALGIPNEQAYIEAMLHGRISSTILAAGPYELSIVGDGP
jgi:hypothetical protein